MSSPFQGLDHLAIVVSDTEQALTLWRDRCGFPVVVQEKVNNGEVMLTHLDLGNTHLQLVEPLIDDHPLQEWLAKHGSGLHHFCFKTDNIDEAVVQLPPGLRTAAPNPHQGTEGKRAIFIDRTTTQDIQLELTGL